jgi:hypothetical protein
MFFLTLADPIAEFDVVASPAVEFGIADLSNQRLTPVKAQDDFAAELPFVVAVGLGSDLEFEVFAFCPSQVRVVDSEADGVVCVIVEMAAFVTAIRGIFDTRYLRLFVGGDDLDPHSRVMVLVVIVSVTEEFGSRDPLGVSELRSDQNRCGHDDSPKQSNAKHDAPPEQKEWRDAPMNRDGLGRRHVSFDDKRRTMSRRLGWQSR